MHESHIGDAAELYAIGALTPEEQAEVDAHIARCSDCLRRVGEAEETVLALERVNVPPATALQARKVVPFAPRRRSSWWIAAVATAAAFVLGFLIPHRAPQTELATVAMLHSHFAHAQFVGPGAPTAKVLYARDRSWYYVIVDGSYRYEVFGVRGGQRIDVGTTTPKSETSELFVRTSSRFDAIELRDSGKFVETAAVR